VTDEMERPLSGDCASRVRKFNTGADRDTDDHKIDPEGALSPLVIQRYAEYLKAHSYRHDGTRRPADNWQKGMPRNSYASSLWRHMLHWWLLHRGHKAEEDGGAVDIEDALCGVLFNAHGYLHEILKER
jgi:hypothetical protein